MLTNMVGPPGEVKTGLSSEASARGGEQGLRRAKLCPVLHSSFRENNYLYNYFLTGQ